LYAGGYSKEDQISKQYANERVYPVSNIFMLKVVLVKYEDNDLMIEKFKEETYNKIYPKAGDTLLEFL